MENCQPVKTSYSKKESWIDSTAFMASSVLTCAAKSIAPLDPAAIGLLLSAAANTVAVQGASVFAQKHGIDSRLIQLCALISALAISTLALPWILSAASLHTLALLSFETAIESTLVHIAFKAATYGAFQVGLYIKDAFTISLPTSLQNVQKLPQSELVRIRDHLANFPSKGQYLSLPIHQELRARLKEADLDLPPLTHFSELGEDWSDRDLNTLHRQDLRGLPLHKKAQLNELFFARDFPPQQRPYEVGELPKFDASTVLKLPTSSKLSWVHLILRLNKSIKIPAGLPQLFYKYELPPVRNEWIPMSIPTSPEAVSKMEEYEIGWYQNFYAEHPEDWKALSAEFQIALKGRFKTPSLFSSLPSTPLTGRASKNFPWNTVVTGVALGALGIAAYYTLSTYSSTPIIDSFHLPKPSTALVPAGPLLDRSPVHIDFSTLQKPIETILQPTTALVPAGPLLDKSPLHIDFSLLQKPIEKIVQQANALGSGGSPLDSIPPRLNFSDIPIIPIIDKTFQYAAPLGLPIIQNTSIPEIVQTSKVTKIADIAAKVFPNLEFTQAAPLSSITSTWLSPLNVALGAVTILGVCSLAHALIIKKINMVKAPSEEEQSLDPDSPKPSNSSGNGVDRKDTVAPIGSDGPPNRLTDLSKLIIPPRETNWVELRVGKRSYRVDLLHPHVQQNLPRYLSQLKNIIQHSPADLITTKLDDGRIWSMPVTKVLEGLDRIEGLEAANERKAIEAAKERKAIEAVPPRSLTKQKFMKYCLNKHVRYDHQTAWNDAKEGVLLYQQIRKDIPVDPTKENLRKICWGMMAHKVEQGIGFENGTFVVKDSGYRLFKTFSKCSECYGRASSHFTRRAIPTTEGLWKGYSHFGADIDNLPPNMRTILMGMIETKTGEEATYIKLEDWGADIRLNSLDKVEHFFFHSLGFLTSQYRRFMETNQIDDDRKEHLNPSDKKRIKDFVKKVQKLIPEEKQPDLNEWGFIEAVPYLVKALEHPEINAEIADDIRSYLAGLDKRYGEKLYSQKGNEVHLESSILFYDPEPLMTSTTEPIIEDCEPKTLESSFVFV